ncbi:G-protein coupled receptors family 3 profile domain-containing protein [Plasmodiophora brassicae]
MTQPSLFVRLARCVGGMTVQLRFWCWGVVIVGSAVCQFTCDTNPCMFLSPAQTCCPTYPCQNTSNPNEQFVELAIIENFSYGNYRSIQVAIDHINKNAWFPGKIARVRWMDPNQDTYRIYKAFFCTALNNMSFALPATTPILLGAFGLHTVHKRYVERLPSTTYFTLPIDHAQVSIASIAGYMGLPMIGSTATDPALSDKTTYPTFNRLEPPDNKQSIAIVETLKYFGWHRICIISTSDTYGTGLTNALVARALSNNITIAAVVSFDPQASPVEQLQRIMDTQVRIIVAPLLNSPADTVFQAAATMGLTEPQYVWFGTDGLNVANLPASYPRGLLMSLMYLDVTNPMLGTWATEYVMKSQTNRALGYSAPYSPYPYDVTLFGFYVIRKMMQQGIPMTPANVLSMIRNTTMLGATGLIELDANGDRIGQYCVKNLVQQQDGSLKFQTSLVLDQITGQVAVHNAPVFGDGTSSVPVDAPQVRDQLVSATNSSCIAMIIIATIGLIAAASCLAFNEKNRALTYIKMSSPTLNNLIIAGCMLAYLSIIVTSLLSLGAPLSNAALCTSRTVMLSMAFSLGFGVLSVKTWRVARIFSMGELRIVKITDGNLLLKVSVLLGIDALLLVIWFAGFPLHSTRTNLNLVEDPTDPLKWHLQRYVVMCSSSSMTIFTDVLLAYKALVIVASAFLAFKTSHVQIPAMNDSKQIGLAIYTSGLISVIVLPTLDLVDVGKPDAALVVSSMAIWACASSILTIVFLPKVYNVTTGAHSNLTATNSVRHIRTPGDIAGGFKTIDKNKTSTTPTQSTGKNADSTRKPTESGAPAQHGLFFEPK